jgi:putative membrane protein
VSVPATKNRAGLGDPGLEGRSVEEASFVLSSRRTRLSFQRPRMSADRTLMSILRTALALISFGFTIFQFFRFLRESAGVTDKIYAARNFSAALIGIGILLLLLGIAGHIRFMLELRAEHGQLVGGHLIPHDRFPYSVTLAVSLLVLFLGLFAIISVVFHVGPFS